MVGIRLIISLVTFAAITTNQVSAAQEDGVALAIVYDTSGSMKEPVRDRTGLSDPVGAAAEIYVLQALTGG